MGWDPPEELSVRNPVTVPWIKKVVDSLLWLYSQTGSSSPEGIPNGSAEIDSDEDGTPDTWTYDDYPGGTGGIEETSPAHGAKAFYCTHPGGAGNGGRAWESDYAAISEDLSPVLRFFLWATAAGMKIIVRFKYYDKDKNHLAGSDEDIYSSTSNPTARTAFIRFGIPPATARFIKIVLIGGYTDTDVAGTCYFDGLQFDSSPNILFDSFTIAEGSTGSTSYADIGSATRKLPKGFTSASLLAEGHVASGLVYIRYRISTAYSNEVIFDDDNYKNQNCALDISALSGSQTLYMQAKITAATGYGRKSISGVIYARV